MLDVNHGTTALEIVIVEKPAGDIVEIRIPEMLGAIGEGQPRGLAEKMHVFHRPGSIESKVIRFEYLENLAETNPPRTRRRHGVYFQGVE